MKRAQEAVDAINTAAEEWAKGKRQQVIKDMLTFRGARVRDDGTVELTRSGVLSRVARIAAVGESTLRDWIRSGDLHRVPPPRGYKKK